MSYIHKKGWTSSVNKMITRQQISDTIAYGFIRTTHAKAKITQIYLEKLITLAKKGGLDAKRKAAAVLLTTKNRTKEDLLHDLFHSLAPKYAKRPGGYTRVLKLGARKGDQAEESILQLV